MRLALATMTAATAFAAIAAPAGAVTTVRQGPVSVTEEGIVIDTGIRCVTEPCPSHVVIPLPPLKP